MSDLERKLRDLPFRAPPASWRRDILANAAPADAPRAWNWREWLWPSPAVWGAMAALWIILLSIHAATMPDPANGHARKAAGEVAGSLYALQSHRDLPALLESLN
jgi:hypothetical protein